MGFDDVRVGIPTPNGAWSGGGYELMQSIPAIDDVLTSIKYGDDSAFQPSTLPLWDFDLGFTLLQCLSFRKITNIANDFFWSTVPVEGVDYKIVVFTGSMDATEIANATRERQNTLDKYPNVKLIVVSLFPNQPQELQDFQTGGIIDISDVDVYFTLTSDICNGNVAGEPTDIPTPVPVPAFPGNVDIFVQFSATGCPNPANLDLVSPMKYLAKNIENFNLQQITVIQNLIKNYTFEEDGVRAAILTPFSMNSVGNELLFFNKENILQTIQTIESFSKRPDFCSNGPTITHAFEDINDLLRIKANSSAAVILFSDST